MFFTILKHVSGDFNPIEMSRHPLSLFLDSFLFLFHFRVHGGVEVKIWWRIKGEIAA